MVISLRDDLDQFFSGADAFDAVMNLEGKIFRSMDGRRTLRFTRNGKTYFAKLHHGVGWKEILKNLFHLRLPILGARTELRAIERLQELGVATMTVAGFGSRGWNPARKQSFIITDELQDTLSLESFCQSWPYHPPSFRMKKALIEQIAGIARTLHQNGVNHRDFYICHFLLKVDSSGAPQDPQNPTLHLIDLHRVQIRRRTPVRWIIKDLASLYFSSLNVGLTKRDVLRFVRAYRGSDLRRILSEQDKFWRRVTRRAVRLYKRDFGISPDLPWPS
ncbi:lipopolysaccharide core heptose(I) kinase RfaP [bacterium]|nr:lipopolysaccharide core heptose(I) kinase RfaP [bacterium]